MLFRNIPALTISRRYERTRSIIKLQKNAAYGFSDKMLLILKRFEMLNRQSDTWLNMLVKEWIDGVMPAKIMELSAKFKIDPQNYCRNPHIG